jgi:hypothetical protein
VSGDEVARAIGYGQCQHTPARRTRLWPKRCNFVYNFLCRSKGDLFRAARRSFLADSVSFCSGCDVRVNGAND